MEKINIERAAVGNTNVLNKLQAKRAIYVDKLITMQAARDAPVIRITSDLTKIGTYVTTQPIDGDDIEDATQAQNEAALEGIHRYRNAGTVPLLYYVYIFLILLCFFLFHLAVSKAVHNPNNFRFSASYIAHTLSVQRNRAKAMGVNKAYRKERYILQCFVRILIV